jgi:hypothetical protein
MEFAPQELVSLRTDNTNLREVAQGGSRSTYCFRHIYATLRLHEGVDAHSLAEQMGTPVQMIETHYGQVNTIKHATVCCRASLVGSCRKAGTGRQSSQYPLRLF